MAYLTYTQEFQNDVILYKEAGTSVKDVINKYSISTYTLYKILHLNDRPPTPSQAIEGTGSIEGVEHRKLSPNNNTFHERPASTWNYSSDRHKKVQHICIHCEKEFSARERGDRTKFCSKKCKNLYQTLRNSVVLICDYCGDEFRIKNSQADNHIHCKKCRGKNLGTQSSKMARQIGVWLREEFNDVIGEKRFDWFYDITKPNGRFKLDYYLPIYKIGIEYDGEQHFRPSFVGLWESVGKVQKRDLLKTDLCKQNGIPIIRFRYDEPITKESMLMKIYAELQGNELVEVEDKKPLR